MKLQQWKIPERQKRVSWSWEKYNPGVTPPHAPPCGPLPNPSPIPNPSQEVTADVNWGQGRYTGGGGWGDSGQGLFKRFLLLLFPQSDKIEDSQWECDSSRKKQLDETTGLSGTEQWQDSYQQLLHSACAGLEKQTGCRPHGRVGFPHSPMTFVTAVGTAPASGAASAVPSSAPTSRIASWSTIKSEKI